MEVQGGQASLQTPPPAPCCPTLARSCSSEAKNRNVEKISVHSLQLGKMGTGMMALPGAHSPQINLQPKSMAQKTGKVVLGDCSPAPAPIGAGAQKADSCARLRRQSMLVLSGPV